MTNKNYSKIAAAAGIALSIAIAVPAFAQTAPAGQAPASMQGKWNGSMQGLRMSGRGVFGTVSAINGNTLTVTSKMMGKGGASASATSTSTTYTVDATNATVTKSGAASSVSAIAVGDTVMIQGTVSGTSVTATKISDGVPAMQQRAPGVFGTVSAISGTTLTVTGKTAPNSTTAAVTYAVDASNATVTKSGAASSVSAIAVGDTVMIQGTVSGTSVTATKINDGVMGGQKSAPTPLIAGNGQPIVAGSVTAVSGNTVTITNSSNAVYTVDATTAKIAKGNALGTIASISVGDNVVVQGTVNGRAITAYSITDQGTAPAKGSGTANGGAPAPRMGILGSIGNFFKHIFGF